IRENMAVREAVEAHLAQTLVVEQAGAAAEDPNLRDALSRQDEAISAGDSQAFLRADEDFHGALLYLAGNRRAEEAVRHAMVHVNRARHLAPMTREQMRRARSQHEQLMDALRGLDLEGLRWVLRR